MTNRQRINYEEVRRQISFERVLEHFGVEVVPTGKDPGKVSGVCPLPQHEGPKTEKHLFVNLEFGVFFCRGCGAKGSVLDFLVLMQGGNPLVGGDFRAGVEAIPCELLDPQALPDCDAESGNGDKMVLGTVITRTEEVEKASAPRASPWPMLLLVTEIGFVIVSVYASIAGLELIPHAPRYNIAVAALFSLLALGMFNVTMENIKAVSGFWRKCHQAMKTGWLFLIAAVIPGWGTYTFFQKSQMDEDGTRRSGAALVTWENTRKGLEERIVAIKGNLPEVDTSQLKSLQKQLAEKAGEKSDAFAFTAPDRSSLEGLESDYRKQMEAMAREGDTGVGTVFKGKREALEAIRLDVEKAREMYAKQMAEAQTLAQERALSGRARELEALKAQVESERKAVEDARERRESSVYGRQLQRLETEMEAHLKTREGLEQELQNAKEKRGMMTLMAEKTGLPLNLVLLIMTVALEGATYAAAFGVQTSCKRHRQG